MVMGRSLPNKAVSPPVTDKNPDETQTEHLRRRALSILNKLSLRNLQTSAKMFQELPIDSHQKLVLCTELLFEKASNEPSITFGCAKLCCELQYKRIRDENNPGENINIKRFLITK